MDISVDLQLLGRPSNIPTFVLTCVLPAAAGTCAHSARPAGCARVHQARARTLLDVHARVERSNSFCAAPRFDAIAGVAAVGDNAAGTKSPFDAAGAAEIMRKCDSNDVAELCDTREAQHEQAIEEITRVQRTFLR